MIIPQSPRFHFLLGGVTAIGLVAVGVLMAKFMNLAACPLCIWQRILYLLYGVLALSGAALAGQRGWSRVFGISMAASAATGAGIAGYQVWIQRFAPMTSCAGKEPWWEAFVRWAGDQVPLLFRASGLCSDPAWKFLDLSIADWSLLVFCGLFLNALASFLRGRG